MNIPDRKEISRIRLICRTPLPVIEHMEAVALMQDNILDSLEDAGFNYNRELLLAAALLHDICRAKSDHALAGANILRFEGYPEVADIVSNHHAQDSITIPALDRLPGLTHADILYYADKRIAGTRIVSIEERFAASRVKCLTQEAILSHDAQLARARDIEQELLLRISSV